MKKKNNKGFTLVELIIVIVILGILAAVAVPAYSRYITRANEAADVAALDSIKTAAIAACAKRGQVSAISVSTNTDTGAVTGVTATVGGNSIVLVGENAATEASDYSTFTTGNSYTLNSSTYKAGAHWSASSTDSNWASGSSAS